MSSIAFGFHPEYIRLQNHSPTDSRSTLDPREVHSYPSFVFSKSTPTVFLVKPLKEAFGDYQTALGEHERVDTSKYRGNEPIPAFRKYKA